VWSYARCVLLTFLRSAHRHADTVGRTEKIFDTAAKLVTAPGDMQQV